MTQNEQLQKPFFAKFLESQQTAKQTRTENQQGEQNTVSLPIFDLDHTLKFPSDGDEDIL
jgi:hypothetical protein